MKNNNKGFSLVELIVVIAIMAVLVGVLAPTLLRYVEKSRVQKDASAVGEVVQAIKIALADEDVIDDMTTAGGTATVTINGDGTAPSTGGTVTSLDDELAITVKSVTFSSSKKASVEVEITIADDGTASLTVTAGTGAGSDWKAAVEKASES